MGETDPKDIFFELPDDDSPVTRGQMRSIVRGVRNDLRWAVALTVIANQTLSHVDISHDATIVGGITLGAVALAKLVVAKTTI